MKKIIALIFVIIVVAFMLTACAKATPNDPNKISIVSTIFPSYDFAREIAKENANISMLLPPASESHSFEPTPQDIIKIQNCDIFIYVGGESDEWVSNILSSIDTSNVKIITLMDCVEVVEEKVVEGMQEEKGEEEGKTEYDEHVWTSPKNTKLIIQKISDAICEVDSANSEVYKQNTSLYITKLNELDKKFQDVVANATRKTIVFGDRFPFYYFADAYGLNYYAAFPGCATETEASATTIKFLIDKVNAEKIPVVFHIELSNEKMANTISESTGAKVRLLHACHNISRDDFEGGKTYLNLMTQNVDTLKEALS